MHSRQWPQKANQDGQQSTADLIWPGMQTEVVVEGALFKAWYVSCEL